MFKKSIFDLLEPTKEVKKDQQIKRADDEYKKYLDFSQNQDNNVPKPKIDFKFKKQAKLENIIKPAQISKTPEIKKTTSQHVPNPQQNKIKNMMLNLNRSYEEYINFNFQSKDKISKSIQLLTDGKIQEADKKQQIQVKNQETNNNNGFKFHRKPDNRIRSSNTLKNNNLSQNQKIKQVKQLKNNDSYLKEINKKQEQEIQYLKQQLMNNQQKQQNLSQQKPCSDCKKIHKLNQCQLKLPKLDYCFDCDKYHERNNCKTQKKTKVPPIKQHVQQREMEEEEEDFSDSFEQDSFIDDTEFDNYNKQKIMKQLRKVTKYDPNKYKDSLSDDVQEANFDEIEEEEYITKRHAIIEDQIELKRIKLEESRPRKY